MWFKYFETSASYWIRPLIMVKAIDRSTLISSLPNRFAGLVCTEVIKSLCVPRAVGFPTALCLRLLCSPPFEATLSFFLF